MKYTGIPDNLPDAQAMIERLMDEQERAAKIQAEDRRALDETLSIIQAARKSLNAVEAPAATQPTGNALQ